MKNFFSCFGNKISASPKGVVPEVEKVFETQSYKNLFPGKKWSNAVVFTTEAWGIKIGEKVMIDLEACTIFDAMRAALKYPYAEVIYDTDIEFRMDGSITLKEAKKRTVFFNLEKRCEKWDLVNYENAVKLFPNLAERLNSTEENLDKYKDILFFIVSADFQKVVVAVDTFDESAKSGEIYECPCSFSSCINQRKLPIPSSGVYHALENIGYRSITDYGNIKELFVQVSQMIEEGYANRWMGTEKLYQREFSRAHIDGKRDTEVCKFLIGFPELCFEEALRQAQNPEEVKAALINQVYLEEKGVYPLFYDGRLKKRRPLFDYSRDFVVPYETYKAWTKPYSEENDAFANRERAFGYRNVYRTSDCKAIYLINPVAKCARIYEEKLYVRQRYPDD